ncbi:hypothetical protein PEKONANI_00146 [Aeromonas jandaei]
MDMSPHFFFWLKAGVIHWYQRFKKEGRCRGPLSFLMSHADAGIHQLVLTATRRRCSQMMAPNSRKPGIHISSLRQRSVGALTARIS